jgi:glycosyltransferase involved in cell wall biosynthesis
MRKIIYLPFENLPQRYTAMWNDSFIKELSERDLCVYGTQSTSKIFVGEFLDVYDTVFYKQSQIKKVVELFKNKQVEESDVFFVPDIFYPGLEAIRYMSELSGIRVKIAAFNHAGRADRNDFVQQLGEWSDIQEKAWHQMCDIVFVGSEYHRKNVQQKFQTDNVIVTGAIWSKEWINRNSKKFDKEEYCIFPHRICQEKGFDMFLEIARMNPCLKFIITSCGNKKDGIEEILPANVEYRPNLTKKQYFEVFAKAKYYLSCAHQETFGYTVQEAIYFGCRIIAPNQACYPEYVSSDCLMPFDEMATPGYVTWKFKQLMFAKSAQFEDNAKNIYNILKQL